MNAIKHFFTALLIIAAVACSQKNPIQNRASLSCIAPAFLEAGDTIALLSPSYGMPMESIDSAAAVIRSWGFVPVIGPNVGNTYRGSYAGTPEERVADLRWALRNPSVKAILCNRGGYGTIHMIDLLAPEDFSRFPKWLVGYSDITTLTEMETCSGVMSIHGAMGRSLIKHNGQDESSILMRDILTGSIPRYTVPAHPQNIPGSATGVLVGGNLCTFSPILGTWADATAGEDFILFMEEVEENMSHIDRLMNTLILNGVFNRCKGVILGQFTDCEANLEYESVEQLLCSYLKDYGIPVCCGFPAGHDEVNYPLIMGSRVTLTVTDTLSTISFQVSE